MSKGIHMKKTRPGHNLILQCCAMAMLVIFGFGLWEASFSKPVNRALWPDDIYPSASLNSSSVLLDRMGRSSGVSKLRRVQEMGMKQGREFTWPPTPDPFPPYTEKNGQNFEESGEDSPLESDGSVSSSDAIPAVMVAVASSIIVCAILLYVSDLRDRWRHERVLDEQRHRREIENSKQLETVASSGGYWITSNGMLQARHHHHLGAFPMLPPAEQDRQPEFVEEISISPVSTMTASLAPDSQIGMRRTNSDSYLDDSMDITELSETNRVSQDTDLQSLVDLSRIYTTAPFGDEESGLGNLDYQDKHSHDAQKSKMHLRIDDTIYMMSEDEDDLGWTSSAGQSESSSEVSIGTYLKSVNSVKSRSSSTGSHGACSSSTKDSAKSNSLSNEGQESSDSSSETSEVELHGEHCLQEVAHDKNQSGQCSLGRSPDTPRAEGGGLSISDNELYQLAQLYKVPVSPEDSKYGRNPKLSLLEQLLERGRSPLRHNAIEERDEVEVGDQEYIRSIFYVPVCSSVSTPRGLGIEVEDPSCASGHPSVKSIHHESPLRGRIFTGDVILAVNNEGTVGLDGHETTQKLAGAYQTECEGESRSVTTEVVKLTVMSLKSDGSLSSGFSKVQRSIDVGIESTAIEV